MPIVKSWTLPKFAVLETVNVAQLVRASDCGSEGRGFESRLSPQIYSSLDGELFIFHGFTPFTLHFLLVTTSIEPGSWPIFL